MFEPAVSIRGLSNRENVAGSFLSVILIVIFCFVEAMPSNATSSTSYLFFNSKFGDVLNFKAPLVEPILKSSLSVPPML